MPAVDVNTGSSVSEITRELTKNVAPDTPVTLKIETF
jgi:hypothetical protein